MGPHERPRRSHLLRVTIVNLVYAGAISALTLTPTPPAIPVTDWLLHTVAFAVQAALLHWLLRARMAAMRSLVVAAACAMGYGLMIELLQLFVPGRFFQLSDLLANGIGIAISAATLLVVEVNLRSRPEASS